MASFRSDPFLWIHLAGIAVVPISLQLVWLALAIGEPLTWYWLELLIIASLGILPVFWMQWTRPFDIYSLLVLAIKPEELTVEQQKILRLFKNNKQRILTIICAIIMTIAVWFIYQWAPLAVAFNPWNDQPRILGLLIAIIAFLISNLFLQVPASVIGVMLNSQDSYQAIAPISTPEIAEEFSIFGLRVKKILPEIKKNEKTPS